MKPSVFRLLGSIFSKVTLPFLSTTCFVFPTYPVSYTHLDVYKRQAEYQPERHAIKAGAFRPGAVLWRGASGGSKRANAGGTELPARGTRHGPRPVSYTHLDVYERQG